MTISRMCIGLSIPALLLSWTPSNSQDLSRLDKAIADISATLPRKVDAATTVVEARNDGHGGIVYVSVLDTNIVSMPSPERVKHILCDVTSDSPPGSSHNPFSGITYIYRDLSGRELMQVHFGRGECPGQRL